MNINQNKILIADSEVSDINFLGNFLREQGYQVETTNCGQSALNLALESPPDLILLDIFLSNIDGYEVCARLKQVAETQEIPIIFISASNQINAKIRAFELGCVDYISKPFYLEEVLVRIRHQITICNLQKQLKQEVSDRIRTEIENNQLIESLQQNQASLKAAQRVARLGNWKFDLITGKITWSEEMFRMMGLDQNLPEPTYDTFKQSILPEDLEEFEAIINEAITSGNCSKVEVRICLPNGKFNYIEARGETILNEQGQTVALFGTAMNITERKRTQIALQQQLEHSNLLRQITEQIRSQLDSQQIFEIAVTQIGKAFNASRSFIHTYLPLQVPRIPIVAEYLAPGCTSLKDREIPVIDNPHAQKLLLQDKAIAITDVYAEPLLEGALLLCDYFQLKSMLSVRTSYQGEPNGIIGLQQCDRYRQWTEAEIQLLESIAAQLGIAIAQANLLEQERQARDLLKSVFDESADAIFLADAETNIITECNKQAIQMFEANSKDELLNIPGHKFHKQISTMEELVALKEEIDSKGFWNQEIEYITQQGKEFWGNLAIKQISVAGEKINLVRVTDISDRKQKEEALKESEERWQLAIKGNNDGIYDVNLKTGKAFYSNRWKEMLGYANDDINNEYQEWLNRIHPDDFQQVMQINQEHLDGKIPYFRAEYRLRCIDDSYKWVLGRGKALWDAEGNPIRLVGSHTDISDRKALEREIILREKRLNAFFHSAPVGMKILDDQMRFVQINEPLAVSNGLPMENHIGKSLREVLPTIAPILESLYHYVLSTGQSILHQEVSGEVPNQLGKLRHWVVSYFPIPGEDSRACVGAVVAEITERKQAELKLRLVTERLQHLLAYSPAVIFSCKPDGDNAMTFMSNNVSAVLGYNVEEFLADANLWVSNIHPEDGEQVFAQITNLFEKGYHSQEYRFRHKNGIYYWLYAQLRLVKDIAGNPIEIVGYAVDITQRKQVEEILQESAQRERAIATVIQRMRQTLDINTIFAATTQQLRQVMNGDRVVVYRFNPDWSGEFVAESVGDEWISLLSNHPSLTQQSLEDNSCVIKNLNSNDDLIEDTYLQKTQGGAYSRGTSYQIVEDIYEAHFNSCYIELLERFQVRSYIIVPIFCGNSLWGLLATYQNSGPRQWSAGEINIMVQIGNHLGVALQQAQLLSQTKTQSEVLQKMVVAADAASRAKSEFLANMSHELRTPLNAILGFSQLMSRDNSLSIEHQNNLGIINRAGEHLLELINDILEMSKIEAGRTMLNESIFDIINLLNNLEQMLRLRAESKKLKLLFEFDSSIPQYIQADQSKLRQVLINLLGNALKFTEKGSIILRAKMKTEEGNFNNQLTVPNHRLYFEVEDTGLGIASQEMHLLFEAFGQTETGRKSQQGTGLGLAISRKYVQLMGGDIKVSSVPGLGSVFSFDILINLANPTDIEITHSQVQITKLAPDQPQYRILVADDIYESRLLMRKLLTSIGFDVQEAENGQQVISLWESWQPHLILMDMQMPIISGYEATKHIKAREEQAQTENSTIIIALTASAFEKQRQAILSAGCNDFIRKPFQENVLLEKIGNCLGVRYVYAERSLNDEQQSNNEHLSVVDKLIPDCLNSMSTEWVKQLYYAASQGSDDLILKLIEQLPQENVNLANFLKKLANNFEFEKIINLTEKQANEPTAS